MALAIATLASCSKVETIEPGYKSAIGFSKSFVDNTTKALIEDADDLKNANFAVWGTEEGASIFSKEEVAWDTDAEEWKYAGTPRYWHGGNNYVFAAIAPANQKDKVSCGSGVMPVSATYTLASTLAEQVDLLYANSGIITPSSDEYNTAVAFTFNHMLSKVQFEIQNTYPAGYTVEVENLTITAAETATVTFDGKTWAGHTDEVTLPFTIGSTVNPGTPVMSNESLIIPKQAAGYVIEGAAKVKMGGVVVKEAAIDYTISSDLVAGNHYNIVVQIIPRNPIKFSVNSVGGFENGGNATITPAP